MGEPMACRIHIESHPNHHSVGQSMPVSFAAYQKMQRLPDFPVEELSERLRDPDTFVWMTITDPTEGELLDIKEEFGLHELAIEDASSPHQRAKLEEYDDTLFLVIHTAELAKAEIFYRELHVFVGKQFVILIQKRNLINYDRVRSRYEGAKTALPKGTGYVLYLILDALVDELLAVAAHLQIQLDDVEEGIFSSEQDQPLIEQLYDLKRDVARLHNAASPVVDICSALSRLHPDIVPKDLRPYYRDVQDHVVRVVKHMEMLRDALSDAMQVNLALFTFRQNEFTVRQNEVVKRLAGWGAILALPTMLFSMYGMNFKYMPELESQYGYPIVLTITLVGCIWLYKRLKRSGWL